MSRRESKKPESNVSRIAEAFMARANARQIDLSSIEKDVAPLSSRTQIESFDVNEAAISIGPNGHFSGEGIVYLQLLFFPKDISMGEELPVSFDGTFDEMSDRISFDRLEVDLSPLGGSKAN